MSFFNYDTSLTQAEQQLESYIHNNGYNDFLLKDLPLSYDDFNFINYKVTEYSRSAYSFDDYGEILLLFILNVYHIFKTTDGKNILKTLFLNNASHIPQHHMKHLVYLIVNLFMELDIAIFGMDCDTLEDIMHIVQRHAKE